MRKRFLKYCLVWLTVALAAVGALGALNLLVDPFGAYRVVSWPALEAGKSRLGSRVGKAEILRHSDCQVLILGTSRAEIGFDARHACWGTDRVCNLALKATNFHETGGVFRHAVATKNVSKVLLGTDFLMFAAKADVNNDYERSRFNPSANLAEYHLHNLLSLYATQSSLEALRDCGKSQSSRYTPLGNLVARDDVLRNPYQAFQVSLWGVLRNPNTLNDFVYNAARIDILREMVGACRRKGIELIVVIPPVHALQLEAVRAAGHWTTFERWKRDLVEVKEDDLRQHPSPQPGFALWDFTGYTPYTTEPPPTERDNRPMKWYLESSHFKAALGDLVLCRIHGLPAPDGSDLAGLGVRLDGPSLDSHLADLRAGRDQYARDNADWIEQVNQYAAKAARQKTLRQRHRAGATAVAE